MPLILPVNDDIPVTFVGLVSTDFTYNILNNYINIKVDFEPKL